MDDPKEMTVKEFDLLVRSIHRAYTQNAGSVRALGDSLFFGDAIDRGIQISSYTDYVSVRINENRFRVWEPMFLFRKRVATYKSAYALLRLMWRGETNVTTSTEKLICDAVPTAKDIIAEKALVNDHED